MSRRKQPPAPTFAPWSDDCLRIRHHEHDIPIGHIQWTRDIDPDSWLLSWEEYLPTTRHADVQAAVAHAVAAYADYLLAEEEATRDSRAREEYEERFVRQRASAVARAVRVPTGGQRGWKPARDGDPA